VALPTEAYEVAWKNDESIRATAEAILQEWQNDVKEAEKSWELTRLIESKEDPQRALSVILGIMALDLRGEHISLLGAGPLEDLLGHSGSACIDSIERLAARNPKFKQVLSHVWPTPEMDSKVWQRVKEVLEQTG